MGTSKDRMIETIDPTTEAALSTYAIMDDSAVDRAIDACHTAFQAWRHWSLEDRAAAVRSVADGLREHRAELAGLMTSEMGKLLAQSRQEIDLCINICEYEADQAPTVLRTQSRKLVSGGSGRVSFQPLGVIYGIQPWNYPAYQVVRYAIASLLAGNGVLLKHASNVTGTGQFLERIFQASALPADLFKALIIDHDQSDRIIQHPLVRGVTLTGSPDAGRAVGQKAAAALKKSVLELGSNDAYLVLEDANLEEAVEHCVKGRIYNNGETCIAAKRFIVTEALYDPFRDAFVAAMESQTFGDPTSTESDLGPIAREDLRATLQAQVDDSVARGARVLCGGTLPDQRGYFYPATVLDQVSPGQPAYDDELFGPVAALISARDRDHAMQLANDSRFGLGGGIFSADEDAAIDLAEQHFDTGMAFINRFGLADPAMPFGGVKNSGHGCEHGGFGLLEFVNIKAVITP